MGTDRNDKVTINFAWHKFIERSTFFVYDRVNIPDTIGGEEGGGERMSSGVATPWHTWACAHIKFTGAQWRSQVIGIGRAPAVHLPISPALARASCEIARRERDEHNALARPPFATPLLVPG